MLYFCRNRAACGFCGTSDPTPTTIAGHVLVAGYGLDHRALFVRVVHQRANAAEHRMEHVEADAASRSAVGTRIARDGTARAPWYAW